MKVKELMKQLKEVDQDAEIYCDTGEIDRYWVEINGIEQIKGDIVLRDSSK